MPNFDNQARNDNRLRLALNFSTRLIDLVSTKQATVQWQSCIKHASLPLFGRVFCATLSRSNHAFCASLQRSSRAFCATLLRSSRACCATKSIYTCTKNESKLQTVIIVCSLAEIEHKIYHWKALEVQFYNVANLK